MNIKFSILIMAVPLILSSGFRTADYIQPETVIDIDSNAYHTVSIGTQVWMIENLKVTKFRDGSPIPLIITSEEWIYMTTTGYCWYKNDSSLKDTYGALYNWATVATGKLCPSGWHVPTDSEWNTLITYLGGEDKAGNKLKESDTDHWVVPNEGSTNESGFTALPGGDRSANGSFSGLSFYGTWWSSSENGNYDAWYQLLYSSSNFSFRTDTKKRNGLSVRCLRDM